MNYLSKLARGIQPYTAGEQCNDKQYVKLNTNENPYPPSPSVEAALRSFPSERLNLYPSPNADALREAIARAEGVEKENVFCGNGSDEVLALCFPAFFDPDGAGACFADVTYSFYSVFADFFRVPQKIVPLKADYTMDLSAMARQDCAGYFVTNPNAPTGIGIDRARMASFIGQVQGKLVVADEAYMGFYGESCAPLVAKYDNLLVVKTFSKYFSLAGIRCGYAIGGKELIAGLFRVKDCFNSYPLDAVCQAVCAAALSDGAYYAACGEKVKGERARVREALLALGFRVPASDANFLFAGYPETGGRFLYEELKKRGVLVRYWNRPRLADYCRITVGTKEQNDILIQTIKNILGK